MNKMDLSENEKMIVFKNEQCFPTVCLAPILSFVFLQYAWFL